LLGKDKQDNVGTPSGYDGVTRILLGGSSARKLALVTKLERVELGTGTNWAVCL